MYRNFFGIEERPFFNTPDPQFLYMSTRHKEALAHLIYGIESGGGFVLLTGEVGTGKTTLSRYLAENLPDNVDLALCVNPRLTEAELLANICDDMGIYVSGSRTSIKDLTDAINRHLLAIHGIGRSAAVIIDEAQNLSFELLEQVRLLTNLETAQKKLLQVILIGQPELKQMLDQPNLRQMSQRITARYHLEPLSNREIGLYIAHRAGVAGLADGTFSTGAVAEIAAASDGIPRLINNICERCLLGAYAQGTRTVHADLARKAVGEVLGDDKFKPRRSMVAPLAVTLAIAGLALFTVILDPWDRKLAPGMSNSPMVAALRREIATWPGFGRLFPDLHGEQAPSPGDQRP